MCFILYVCSLWEAGQILVMDYLWIHGPLIEKLSYIEGYFTIPTTVEELAALLPGNSQFDDIDELLIKLGKQHDRALLHSSVSKLFKVPQKLLINAERNRASLIPKSVLDAVYDRRKKAKDAAAAAASAQSSSATVKPAAIDTEIHIPSSDWPKPKHANASIFSLESRTINGDDDDESSIEYADPEHLCTECLPVYGDDIVGTLPENDTIEATPKVHRLCCSIAQRAINRELAGSKRQAAADFSSNQNICQQQQVDSASLRRGVNMKNGQFQDPPITEVPVKLQWSAFPGRNADEHEHFSFPCEIVLHCEDRKLLLADCSETVSELSEIVKTGSQTTNEHATLVFLVKIRCLDDLQKVMNSLRQIPSVMAVERRVSSSS